MHKDINGVNIKVGDTVQFYTWTPDKMLAIRKVRLRNNELWAGEIPISLLKKDKCKLEVIY